MPIDWFTATRPLGVVWLFLRIQCFVILSIIGAVNMEYHNQFWCAVYFASLVVGTLGIAVLLTVKWQASRSVVYRWLGELLLFAAVCVLLLLSMSPSWETRVEPVGGANGDRSAVSVADLSRRLMQNASFMS